jgi:hypothetical protein
MPSYLLCSSQRLAAAPRCTPRSLQRLAAAPRSLQRLARCSASLAAAPRCGASLAAAPRSLQRLAAAPRSLQRLARCSASLRAICCARRGASLTRLATPSQLLEFRIIGSAGGASLTRLATRDTPCTCVHASTLPSPYNTLLYILVYTCCRPLQHATLHSRIYTCCSPLKRAAWRCFKQHPPEPATPLAPPSPWHLQAAHPPLYTRIYVMKPRHLHSAHPRPPGCAHTRARTRTAGRGGRGGRGGRSVAGGDVAEGVARAASCAGVPLAGHRW